MILLISSEAMTSPPGESTFNITALTRLSSAARLSCALMISTMLLPDWSTVLPLMMPSTVMTAILFLGSLFLRMHSSSFGPTSRAMLVLKPGFMLFPIVRETPCPTIASQLNPSSTNKMIATIIQPRLLRGLDGGGGVMIGGGVSGGGAPGEENEFSITRGS